MSKRDLVKKGKKKKTGEQQYFTGVYARAHRTRLHEGKPDVCYDICFKRDGKLIWEKVGWASEGYSPEVAEGIRNDRVKAVRHGDQLPGKKAKAPYFKDVATQYVAWAKENKCRAGIDDASRYGTHLKPRFDSKRLDTISPFDLEKMKIELSKDLSPATVKHCLVLFRQIINKAIAWGLWKGDNPVKAVKMPTLQNQKERFLSFDEAGRLLKDLSAVSQTVHDMALISLHCGLRFGEIANLKGQDLNFETGMINVVDPKNKQTRTAFMTNAVKEVMRARIPKDRHEYVFKDKRHGGRIESISQTFVKAIVRLGFNKGVTDNRQAITFHSLRHTFASWLALQGESLLTIRELLGHKSFEMTKRYAHLIPDEKRRATMTLEERFRTNRGEVSVLDTSSGK